MIDPPFNQLIVLGASITASPWMTWADFLEIESAMSVINLSSKGIGNEFMMQSLANVRDRLDDRTLVLVMLTNIDKWDWYVQGDQLHALRQEKHSPKLISDNSGFWCTGSWFPGNKKIYQDLFYNDDYFCSRTIHNILLLKTICEDRRSKLEIFFDSPIWSYTEQDINAMVMGMEVQSRNLLQGDLSRLWQCALDEHMLDLDQSSLLGYCWHNQLCWCNQTYKAHPPSSSHWRWYRDIMRPRISQHCSLQDWSQTLGPKIHEMDDLWQKS
jgi:hypothetical protein